MTADDFRKLALALPETVESAHMGHPDFRVGGKIFASLGPNEAWGMAKLKPDQQAALLKSDGDAFEPAAGAWGRGGATIVKLTRAKKTVVRQALLEAWRNTAPKALAARLDPQ